MRYGQIITDPGMVRGHVRTAAGKERAALDMLKRADAKKADWDVALEYRCAAVRANTWAQEHWQLAVRDLLHILLCGGGES